MECGLAERTPSKFPKAASDSLAASSEGKGSDQQLKITFKTQLSSDLSPSAQGIYDGTTR